jgi:hypothetical protein
MLPDSQFDQLDSLTEYLLCIGVDELENSGYSLQDSPAAHGVLWTWMIKNASLGRAKSFGRYAKLSGNIATDKIARYSRVSKYHLARQYAVTGVLQAVCRRNADALALMPNTSTQRRK